MYNSSSQPIGQPSLGLAEDTIATILDLIETGWKATYAQGNLTHSSQETEIAGRLAGKMLTEKRRRKISHFRIEEEVGTRSSSLSIKPEGRIDIKIIYSFVEEEYFGIECKRVSSSKSDGLSKKYVEKGVLRFVAGKYSPGHGWAAMVGFVIDGDAQGAVQLVRDAISSNKDTVRLCEKWTEEKRFGQHPHLYFTGHRQQSRSSTIGILHLFLPLN